MDDSRTVADDTANNDEPQVSEPGDDDINNVGPVEVISNNNTAGDSGDGGPKDGNGGPAEDPRTSVKPDAVKPDHGRSEDDTPNDA